MLLNRIILIKITHTKNRLIIFGMRKEKVEEAVDIMNIDISYYKGFMHKSK